MTADPPDRGPQAPGVDALLPPEVAARAEAVGVAKASMAIDRLVALSVLAGAFITFGAMLSTVVTAGGGTAPGVARLLGGMVFSLGLVLVVVSGAELFTGNTLIVMAVASGRVPVRSLARNWCVVYVGNLCGATVTTLGLYWAGLYGRAGGTVGARALEVAAAKSSLGVREAFLSGVAANVLVCLAVWMSLSARSVTDKVLAVMFPVTAFVAAGFEHSIANMSFLPAGIFVRAWAPAGFWDTLGAGPGDYSTVDWRNFLVGNLAPVTAGNIVGGAVFVGLAYWFVYLRHRPS